jgi:hypothetical protein
MEVSMSANPKYQKYLDSDCWKKQIRAAALERANYICEARIRCKGAWATETHHKNYACVGVERPEDLMAVCNNCHRALHQRPAKPANDNRQLELPLNDNDPLAIPAFLKRSG